MRENLQRWLYISVAVNVALVLFLLLREPRHAESPRSVSAQAAPPTERARGETSPSGERRIRRSESRGPTGKEPLRLPTGVVVGMLGGNVLEWVRDDPGYRVVVGDDMKGLLGLDHEQCRKVELLFSEIGREKQARERELSVTADRPDGTRIVTLDPMLQDRIRQRERISKALVPILGDEDQAELLSAIVMKNSGLAFSETSVQVSVSKRGDASIRRAELQGKNGERIFIGTEPNGYFPYDHLLETPALGAPIRTN